MQIDEYESQFKSAIKERYQFSSVSLERIALVTDFREPQAESLRCVVERLLPSPEKGQERAWTVYDRESFSSVKDLYNKIQSLEPHLIIAERNLKSNDDDLVYGLSNYIDSLTQLCTSPVLLLPHASFEELDTRIKSCRAVLVETDHITGDNHLINWATAFAGDDGIVYLTHIENNRAFDYYIEAIGRVPEIDTDLAEEKIKEVLLSSPSEFIDDVVRVLGQRCPKLRVQGIVKLGRSLRDYRELLDMHEIDLLTINTKVDGQLAMEGLAYAIAVEFKHVPLLLL